MIATAAGALGLTPSGHLDGELQMTVAGIEQVIPLLGIEKMLEEGCRRRRWIASRRD